MRNIWLGLREMAVCCLLKTTTSYVCMPQAWRTLESYTHLRKSVGEVIRGLMLIHQLLEAKDMNGHVEYL